MEQTEEGLRIQQEKLLMDLARRAMDEGDHEAALNMVQRATRCWEHCFVTLLSIVVFGKQDEHKQVATELYIQQLQWCQNINSLRGTALWMRNPVRAYLIPPHHSNALDERRKALEPGWNGVWEEFGRTGSQVAIAITKKNPREVKTPEECLIAISNAGDWIPWYKRYRELGGDTNDPKFLKVWVAKAAIKKSGRPKEFVIKALRDFTHTASIVEVRKFLRKLTPSTEYLGKKKLNRNLSRHALLLYCECDRLEHTQEDWVHIAESAMYLQLPDIERMVQRILAESERDIEAQAMFEKLVERNGVIQVTNDVLRDIGLRGNPIWNSPCTRTPVNGDARRILKRYSSYEIERV